MITLYYCAVPDRKREHEAAYRLLLAALRERFGSFETLPKIEAGEFGKPYFTDCPGLFFNLSHAGGCAVCALSGAPVGIDIINERKNRSRAAEKFTAAEQEWLKERPEAAFFDLWAKKEAYLKAIGTGLTRRLDSFSVLPAGENCPEPGLFDILLPFPAAGIHCAVCGAERPISVWNEIRGIL